MLCFVQKVFPQDEVSQLPWLLADSDSTLPPAGPHLYLITQLSSAARLNWGNFSRELIITQR